ncbi:hypothetical protein N7532_010932 [Penicillium argentinense]|uniref:LIM zinc-binding domain-containing protein n=1 Tax=Penicillium argentinense TaxID=1131581 RepID=A0A9W9JYK8_9EURO|nr:uncharacterized protein N7532_010932 [Penicillium argentinense]KAJ5086161.1 hypothetical protein N7532_010932 [Penicillium argentinense]
MAMDMGFLPTIKCSNCGCNVEISAMGDHVCSAIEHGKSPRCADSIPSPSAGLEDPDRLTTAMATKPGRGVPPRIDPSVANNAFLQPTMPTPASSVGSHMPSPLSVSSAPRSPLQPSPRQTSPDDDSVLNLDSVFSFPMPGNRSPTRVGTPRLSPEAAARSAAPTPSPRYGLGLDLVPENVQLPPSPLPPTPEPTETNHQRNESMASQSSYRTSLASTRYGSSTARSSANSFSRGFHKYMDETPPLPPAPLKTPNKSSFSQDSHMSLSSSYQSDRAESFGGFDFGIPTNPNRSGLHDLPEERSLDERKASPDQDFPSPSQNRLHPAAAAVEPATEAVRKNSDASSHSALSVTSFARALGLEHQMQKPESSVSSESSPSEVNSGSSMSSLPSDTSLNKFKANDPLNLGPLVEELPPRTRQTILELPGRIRNEMDEVPPIPAAFFSPDSPTDPAINQGNLSLIAEKKETPGSPQPPSSEPPSPRRSIQRAATTPIPRPPTRSATRSKGKCKGCGEEITGKSISSSDGRLTGRYHRGCFVCFECSSPFQTADFYVLNNKPYCAQHYHERNGSLCSTCHNGIEGEYLETVAHNGGRPDRRRFHIDCLQCRTCHVLLKGDYFEWNGGVYCERDAQRAANAYYRPLPGPAGPPGRRRPTVGASPLSQIQTRGYPPPPAGYRPPPSPAPSQGGLRPGPRFPSGGARRFPERRTTKLMMI